MYGSCRPSIPFCDCHHPSCRLATEAARQQHSSRPYYTVTPRFACVLVQALAHESPETQRYIEVALQPVDWALELEADEQQEAAVSAVSYKFSLQGAACAACACKP